MTELETKEFDLELKTLDEEQGTFEGYLAVFNDIDNNREIIEPGAIHLVRTPLPLFYRHNRDEVLGGLTEFKEDERGYFVRGKMDLSVARAREVYSLMKNQFLRGLSPGYLVQTDDYDEDGIRHLQHINVFEGSITPLPAQNSAEIYAVKEQDELDLEDKAVGGSGLPLASKGAGWDEGTARAALKKWSGGSIAKYRRGFLWNDGSENLSGCKLPIATIIGGRLTAVPRAIQAAKGRLNQTQGPSADEKKRILSILNAYSKRLGTSDESDSEEKEIAEAELTEIFEAIQANTDYFKTLRGTVEALTQKTESTE